MKRVIALFLSAILLVSLSVPAFAAEPQQSNRIHAALDTPEFKSAYKDSSATWAVRAATSLSSLVRVSFSPWETTRKGPV